MQFDNGMTVLLDPEDWVSIRHQAWKLKKSKGGWYCYRQGGTRRHQYFVYMHRRIMKCPRGQIVHHKNGNTLDNRKENLVIQTMQQHQARHGLLRISKKVQVCTPRHPQNSVKEKVRACVGADINSCSR